MHDDTNDRTPRSTTLARTLDGFRTDIVANGFPLVADEPESVGGTNAGPTPYDYLLAALGSCTSMTLRMYADHKGWRLDAVSVELSHRKIHARDCADCESDEGYIDHIERTLWLDGDLTPQQRDRLAKIADRCPVHKTLQSTVMIHTEMR